MARKSPEAVERNRQAVRQRYAEQSPDIREKKRERRRQNKERVNEYNRRWYAAHPERRSYRREANRRNHFRKYYGISLEDFEALCVRQDNRCALCGRFAKLVADHNHKTGIIREGLCTSCNLGLGLFQDDPVVLEKAVRYLNKHKPANGGLPF